MATRVSERIRVLFEDIAARQERPLSEVTREALTEFAERFQKGAKKP